MSIFIPIALNVMQRVFIVGFPLGDSALYSDSRDRPVSLAICVTPPCFSADSLMNSSRALTSRLVVVTVSLL